MPTTDAHAANGRLITDETGDNDVRLLQHSDDADELFQTDLLPTPCKVPT